MAHLFRGSSEGFCDGSVVFEVFDGLVLSRHQRICYGCIGRLEEVVVLGNVEELCESCFHKCKSLSRVTFGESSSLKLIGNKAFFRSGIVEIHIPDSVEGLCESCFSWCQNLSRLAFGQSSSLKFVGKRSSVSTRRTFFSLPEIVNSIRGSPFPRVF